MPRKIKRKNKKMGSKTLLQKRVPVAVNPAWPLTEKDYLLNLTEAEVKDLGPAARRALRDYKAGKLKKINSLADLD